MSSFFSRLPLLSCFSGSGDSREELLPLSSFIIKEPVILNVYDLFNFNEIAAPFGLGIFHTGIQVYGREYTYGGHVYSDTGIFEMPPRSAEQELGESVHFRESIHLGYTQFSREEVRHIVEHLGHQFTGNSYHLTSNNCNHFSNTMARVLCGRNIPNWINRLAYFVGCLPFLHHCLPRQWMSPI